MKLFLLFVTLLALLTACGGQAPTSYPVVDVNATIAALSGTMMAGTLTAQPTKTPLPTSTSILIPPTATIDLPTETVIPSPEPSATLTPEPFFGTLAPLGTDNAPKGLFRIENNTDEDFLIININGMTYEGNPRPIIYAIKVTTAVYLFDIPWGDYSYSVQIGTKKTLSGSFSIRNKDKTTMRVSMDKIVIVGP